MTDKIQKIRQEVEKLKSNLLYGACASQVAMETRCKEEAYNEVLAILDTMQNQHVKESAEIQHEDKSCENNGNSLTKEPTSWLDEFRAKLDSLSKEEFEQLWGKYGAEEKEELVSEDLDDYINELSKQFPEVSFAKLSRIAVRVAKWHNEHLWKHADGNNLPIIDREVIALLDNGKVVFAHRPPEFWDGKDIVTGKVTRNYPKTYDKGCWNIPNVKWWLDCLIPKEIEL